MQTDLDRRRRSRLRISAPEPIPHCFYRWFVVRCSTRWSKDRVCLVIPGPVVADGLRQGQRDDLAALARDAELLDLGAEHGPVERRVEVDHVPLPVGTVRDELRDVRALRPIERAR